jgi:hypothetical protein
MLADTPATTRRQCQALRAGSARPHAAARRHPYRAHSSRRILVRVCSLTAACDRTASLADPGTLCRPQAALDPSTTSDRQAGSSQHHTHPIPTPKRPPTTRTLPIPITDQTLHALGAKTMPAQLDHRIPQPLVADRANTQFLPSPYVSKKPPLKRTRLDGGKGKPTRH